VETHREIRAPRCAYCGEVVGVYEPMVLIVPEQPPRRTSRLAEDGLPAGSVVAHEACYDRRKGIGADE
jgi:hypothetical protein